MSLGSIHSVAHIRISFPYKAEEYSTVCVQHIYLYIMWWWVTWACSTFWWLNNAAVTMITYTSTAFFLGVTYPEARWPDHVFILCLTFWGTTKLLAPVAAWFYIPIIHAWRVQFLHMLINTYFTCFFNQPS